MELAGFAKKWCHPEHPPEPVELASLNAVELEFGITLPKDYREQVLAVGLPGSTLALLSGIVDREVDLQDLSELHSPAQIADATHAWRAAGMPKHLLAIGTDSAGSLFCFDTRDLRDSTVHAAPIYFWDHEFGTTDRLATSFPDWIASYLQNWSDGLSYDDF